MELNLDELRPKGIKAGRSKKNIAVGEAVPLTQEESIFAQTNSAKTIEPLKSLTERHHTLARLLATGTEPLAAATVVGYTPARVSVLKSDPAFKELVEFYKDQVDAEYVDMHAQIAGMSQDALVEIRNRMEDDPEAFSTSQLLELFKAGADRSGHGPSTTQNNNVNVNIADRLSIARKRASQAAQVIDITPVEGE